jgi:hypothetical protein
VTVSQTGRNGDVGLHSSLPSPTTGCSIKAGFSDVAGELSGGHCPSARPMARDDSFLAFFVLAKG